MSFVFYFVKSTSALCSACGVCVISSLMQYYSFKPNKISRYLLSGGIFFITFVLLWKQFSGNMARDFLKTIDLKELKVPEDVLIRKNSIKISEGYKTVENAKVYYRETELSSDEKSSHVTLLLLHGQRFSSKTWLDLGTIQIVGAMGYRAVAIDLPGYGESPSAAISNRALFLKHLVEVFDIEQPVIVSPSMSGFYTLPFLLKYHQELTGYIPVAPVGIEALEAVPTKQSNSEAAIKAVYEPLQQFLHPPVPDLSHIKVPTLVVFGEKDHSRSSALLSLLPNSQAQEIPKGGHPAYLDDPDLWHKLLFNFLYHLSK